MRKLGEESPGGREHNVGADVFRVPQTVVHGKGYTGMDDHRRPRLVCGCSYNITQQLEAMC